jgi:glycosyltransferase involved in cell wall biosynthesis
MNPEISVVVPTHNRNALLPLTLRTILDQRDVDFEVVVVDDGSSQDIGQIVAGRADRRVRVIRHDHARGVSTARNHGAAEATGCWLAFCDDDDLWAPHKLKRQLAAASETGRSWSYGGAVRIDSAHEIIGGTPPPVPQQLVERLPRWNLIPGGSSNVIVRSEVFSHAGGWDAELVNLADWDLWIRLSRQDLPACVAEPLVGYRVHAGNASADTTLILREASLLNGRYGNHVDYGELHHYLAWVSLRSGQRSRGLRHLAQAALRGQVRAAGRSAAVLLRARVRRLTKAAASSPPDQAWWREADTWLAPFRASQPP